MLCQKSKKTCSVEYVAHNLGNKGLAFNKKPCCEDKSTFLKVNTVVNQNEISILPDVIQIPDFDYGNSLSYAGCNFGTSEAQKLIKFYLYKPPLPDNPNLRVLYQSFLC
ncbi:MAG: hypothetical protein IPM42_17800 [Saprospiraceae bacterium]|nr:hypothetical protein [Saprospiraceae bacterium]